MNKLKASVLCIALFSLGVPSVNAQGILQRIKQKAAEVADKAVDKKVDEAIDKKAEEVTGVDPSAPNAPAGKNKPVNKGGAGLVTTPPDVKENLAGVETAFKSSNYGDARYALQQAMLGVEMEIGQKLLKSFPESVSGLPKQADQDQVTSSGWGWAGLTVHREYLKEDKQFSLTLANNSMLMSAVNMFLTSGAYGQTTGGQQNWKQTKVKGNRAVIEYDEGSGYKLTVPIGQSSLLVFEGINFANEAELMAAANQFDIEGIKKTLGEK